MGGEDTRKKKKLSFVIERRAGQGDEMDEGSVFLKEVARSGMRTTSRPPGGGRGGGRGGERVYCSFSADLDEVVEVVLHDEGAIALGGVRRLPGDINKENMT